MPESLTKNFNHLKIHSQYSICEGAVKIDDLKDFYKDNNTRALGLSDTSNLCGALEFAEKLSKVGVQPIIGTQINFKHNDTCLLYTSPSPRDATLSRMPSSA